MTDNDQTGRDQTSRRRAEELLLLRVNGRLETTESAELEGLLAQHPEARAEESFLKSLKTAVSARDVPSSPGEFGRARLMRAVAEDAAKPADPVRGAPVVAEIAKPARVAGGWRYAAIAATVLLAVLTASIVADPQGVTRLAGGTVEQAAGPTLVVAFRPDATTEDLRALLVGLDLTIVGGPSALGLYHVAAADDAAAARALEALSAAPIVESVDRE